MGVLTYEPRVDETQDIELNGAAETAEHQVAVPRAEAQQQVFLTLEQRIAEGRMAQLDAIRSLRRR